MREGRHSMEGSDNGRNESDLDREIDIIGLALPIARGWRVIAIVTTLAVMVVMARGLLSKRKYEAATTFTTITKTGSLSLSQSGLLGAALGAAGALGGLQASPVLITRIMTLPGVQRSVAAAPMKTGGTERIIDRLRPEDAATMPPHKYTQYLAKVVKIDLDRETGLVTLRVQHPDSQLARVIAERMMVVSSAAFVRAIQGHAAALRQAQAERVDSVASQLNSAELRLSRFLSANRAIAPFSVANVERERLERAVALAQSVYQQAAIEKEAAIAKEIEATPIIAVVDPVPSQLRPLSRGLAWKLMLTVVLTAIFTGIVLVLLDAVFGRTHELDDRGQQLLASLMRVPVVGRLFSRIPVSPRAADPSR